MIRAWLDATAAFLRGRTTLILAGSGIAVIGIGLGVGYVAVTKATTSQTFCAHACHEMERTVAADYATSRHANPTTGTPVTCAQCHLPQHDTPRLIGHQITGLTRVWGHYVDREDRPGRFEARRPELAKQVLADFAATNARECKACHSYAAMIRSETAPATTQARRDHATAMKTDSNCLSCHQGLTHARQDKPASYDF